VSDHQASYPIDTMCKLLGVSSSGYYAWVKQRGHDTGPGSSSIDTPPPLARCSRRVSTGRSKAPPRPKRGYRPRGVDPTPRAA
jgi:hypothetical protein